ncbi:peptidyl-prolyl cis-trans isomerase [Desulfonatronovibrio hydrogenovorans]|uniref:peptidylprolyl isomerase n=1 Tax=Desulfonatronovibrio hydrogenovorans TaxID=53245 RepID=UPI0004916BCA|nr:peptidylprolyl isomerase [Desulfonatronovibrio hydrogenovorans]
MTKFIGLFFLFIWMTVLSGCGDYESQPGVVARVDGSPIYLEEIESKYDMFFFEWSDHLPPSVQNLKNTYGEVLLDLILLKLINNELESRNLEVTPGEVQRIEDDIRSDYPEGEFENMLIEEYIDINFWRTQIRHKLLWEKFVARVLMPQAGVELSEVQDYYYNNLSEFYIPDRMVFLYLGSAEQEVLEKALELFKASQDVKELRDKFGNIVAAQYEMRVDQLPQNLAGDLKTLEPGQNSRIKTGSQEGMYTLYLMELKEGQLLKPHQVYSIIEKKLTDQKLRVVFQEWLGQALDESRVEINSVLMEEITGRNQ